MFKGIIERLRAETPRFWKKVRNLCTAAGSTAMAIYGYSYYAQLPPIAVEVAKVCACMGFFGVFLSQLTVSTTVEIK
jgi:hypothetical protein